MLLAVTAAAEGRAVRDASFATWLHMLRAEALRGERVLDAAAVAGSTRRFLSGIRELVVSSADVDRLADAVEELESLAGPGGDIDMFLKLLRLHDARAAMDVDGGCPSPVAAAVSHLAREARSSSQGSVLPVPSGKRKRAGCSSGPAAPSLGAKRKIPCCCGSSADGGPTSSVDHRKRRVLAWEKPPPPAQPQSARSVELATARVRGRLGRRRRQQPCLGRQLSRLSLLRSISSFTLHLHWMDYVNI
ncbi:hypothetical protein QOZ80_1AG0010830 [Eleusine coracana subsp. coracana]|nr:hypothetical protein QOZ80_1AG0010830 [Eleusine coracana subsp. coracana]